MHRKRDGNVFGNAASKSVNAAVYKVQFQPNRGRSCLNRKIALKFLVSRVIPCGWEGSVRISGSSDVVQR